MPLSFAQFSPSIWRGRRLGQQPCAPAPVMADSLGARDAAEVV